MSTPRTADALLRAFCKLPPEERARFQQISFPHFIEYYRPLIAEAARKTVDGYKRRSNRGSAAATVR